MAFPVGRIGRYIKRNAIKLRVTADAPVFLAAVMEYLCAEVLEVSGEVCHRSGRKRVTPRHIELACRNDDDLARFF